MCQLNKLPKMCKLGHFLHCYPVFLLKKKLSSFKFFFRLTLIPSLIPYAKVGWPYFRFRLDLDLSNFIVVLYKITTKGLSQKQSFAYQGLFPKYSNFVTTPHYIQGNAYPSCASSIQTHLCRLNHTNCN